MNYSDLSSRKPPLQKRTNSVDALRPRFRISMEDSFHLDSAGVTRTASWPQRNFVLRECICQKMRYHTLGEISWDHALRVLGQLDPPRAGGLSYPRQIVESCVLDCLPLEPPSTRKQREAQDRRHKRFLAMAPGTSSLVAVDLVCPDFAVAEHWAGEVDRGTAFLWAGGSHPQKCRGFVRVLMLRPVPMCMREMCV